MYVIKRDGKRELVQFDKITARIKKLCYSLHESVDPQRVAMRVIEGVYDGVSTTELDNLAAEVAATNAVTHPDYASLASRIAVSNLHKATKKSFAETMNDLYNYVDPVTGDPASLLAEDVHEIIQENAEFLDSQMVGDTQVGCVGDYCLSRDLGFPRDEDVPSCHLCKTYLCHSIGPNDDRNLIYTLWFPSVCATGSYSPRFCTCTCRPENPFGDKGGLAYVA